MNDEQNKRAEDQHKPQSIRDFGGTIGASTGSAQQDRPRWENYPSEDKVGVVRAAFTNFAKPSYGYQEGMSYRLMIYSSKSGDIAIWDTERGQYQEPAFYQSWKEFLRNWTRLCYIHPADALLDELDQLEKRNEINAQSLSTLRKQVVDFKYDR